ncbi:MAG: RnfABCDGE type electron transport complex subunit D [Gammaproteobacteria bacterium]|nr:RnfABCDGE type electron transport complex subunit D [Gammaproteobacteria bacterium]
MRFQTTAAPHVAPITSVPLVMRRVLYALVPAIIAHLWFFGSGLLFNLLVATMAALAAEAAMLRLRGRAAAPVLADGSALVTAVLLALALPPLLAWWIVALGSASAIVLGKHLYGGLGLNLFNPAMVGYVVLLVSFPLEMTLWLPPRMGDIDYLHLNVLQTAAFSLTGQLPAGLTIDGLTRATPLDLVREGLAGMQTLGEIRASPLFGDFGGRGWEWINGFLGLAGIYLLYRGVIRWHIPVSMLAALFMAASLLFFFDPGRFPSPGFHLFSGATMLGAFFIATDPVSAATSNSGRLIYGSGIGLLTYIIRTWGGYPDGVAFAVLLMNACVPLIDRYTRPRPFGHG